MNSIDIQSIVLALKENKDKDFLKQNSQETNIEDDNINVLPTESNNPEDDSIDKKSQELQEDGEGIDLSWFSSIKVPKKEIVKMEQPTYKDEKCIYPQKEIDQALISINKLKIK
jgi:hypothetical protein